MQQTNDSPAIDPTPLPDNVLISQHYLGCLSQASYLIGDRNSGKCIVVDPRRDVSEVLDDARSHNMSVQMIVETHFHADFLSGHLELSAATGAPIGVGAAGETEFESVKLADGQIIDLEGVQIEVWHTPGHTPESICLLVRPEASTEPVAVITGDTLFIGDVGRPDLLASIGFEAADLGAMLHSSVQRLMTLADDVVVFPGHGAGSACGKALSSETVSTIGAQRADNYAVQPMDRDRFIEIVTEGQPTAPSYFVYDAMLNRQDRQLLDEGAPLKPLTIGDAIGASEGGAALVDIRPPEVFALGHIHGAINVGLEGRFAEMAGSVIAIGTPIVLIGDGVALHEAHIRLARIGIDTVIGAVASNSELDLATTSVEQLLVDQPELAEVSSRLTAANFAAAVRGGAVQVVDVRNAGEVSQSPVGGAINIALPSLAARADELDPNLPTVVFCAGGYRSSIAASLLRARGFDDVSDVIGGAGAILAER